MRMHKTDTKLQSIRHKPAVTVDKFSCNNLTNKSPLFLITADWRSQKNGVFNNPQGSYNNRDTNNIIQHTKRKRNEAVIRHLDDTLLITM